MKTPTNKHRQWLWFIGLWCGGLVAVLLLSQLTRWVIAY